MVIFTPRWNSLLQLPFAPSLVQIVLLCVVNSSCCDWCFRFFFFFFLLILCGYNYSSQKIRLRCEIGLSTTDFFPATKLLVYDLAQFYPKISYY